MAGKTNSTLRRSSVIALAVAALSIPSLAEAAPERGGRNWSDGRTARTESSPQQERRQDSAPAPQQRQQQSQAPAPQQTQRNWSPPQQSATPPQRAPQQDRGNGGGRNWTNANQTTTQAPPVEQRRQAGSTWTRNDGNGGNTDRRDRRGDRDGDRNWQGNSGNQTSQGTWTQRNDRRDRDGDYRRDRTQQGGVNWTDAARNRDRDRDRDRDGNRDRWGDHGGNRQYWNNRNWSNHWDRSRYRNWSGWNSSWNWNYGSHYNRWDRRWRNQNRYDWYAWRSYHPSYFQVGYYYAPYRGYSYSRLSIGFFLDALFFGEDYWIADPAYYRLPQAYGPYRWVRYYDDAVLVNIYTGEVTDVIYDFFW